jgi:hypothetical protein
MGATAETGQPGKSTPFELQSSVPDSFKPQRPGNSTTGLRHDAALQPSPRGLVCACVVHVLLGSTDPPFPSVAIVRTPKKPTGERRRRAPPESATAPLFVARRHAILNDSGGCAAHSRPPPGQSYPIETMQRRASAGCNGAPALASVDLELQPPSSPRAPARLHNIGFILVPGAGWRVNWGRVAWILEAFRFDRHLFLLFRMTCCHPLCNVTGSRRTKQQTARHGHSLQCV